MLLNREQREQLRQLSLLSVVGLEMGFCVMVGLLGGRFLDQKFATTPWLQWIGLALGLAAAGRSLYRVVRQAQIIMENEDKSNGAQ